MVTLVLALIVFLRIVPVAPLVPSMERWLAGLGTGGIVAFGAIYVLAALLFVPGSALTVAAGALFGLAWGTVAVSVASTTAAGIAFLIARHLARGAVERKAAANPRFRAIDRAIEQGGWRVIALLRLSPAVPFSLGNYLLGLTAVRFWPYLLASWIAMLPGTFLYVYLGKVGRDSLAAAGGGGSRGPGQWALLVAGLVATAIVIVYVTRLARRALRESSRIESRTGAPSAPRPDTANAWIALGTAGLALATLLAAVLAWTHREELQQWSERSSRSVDGNGGSNGR